VERKPPGFSVSGGGEAVYPVLPGTGGGTMHDEEIKKRERERERHEREEEARNTE
jgi:hypothetical protein